MTVHRTAETWALLTIRPWPDAATQTYRFAMQPFADRASYRGFAYGRVPKDGGFGDVTRSMSTLDAQFDVDSWDLELIDTDGTIRALLADATTNTIDQNRWEIAFEMTSHEGRVAELTPRSLFRGVVTEVTPTQGRKVTVRAKNLLGGFLRGFDLDATIPLWKLKDDFGTLPEFPDAMREQVAPLVYGENSDHGAVDATGANAEKGLVPVFYVGKTLISNGLPGTPPTAPVYLSPPKNLVLTPHGGGATHTVSAALTALTHFGETTLSAIVTISNYPKVTNGTDYVVWTWDPPDDNADQIIAYNLYVQDGGGTPKYRVDQMNNGATFVNPEVTYTDNGDDSHFKGMYPGPPGVNTAQVAAGTPGTPGSGPMFFHTFVVAAGVLSFDHVDFYGADLKEGGTGKRTLLNASTANSGIRNVQIIAPGDTLYPHANAWCERNSRRYTVFYSRGALADAHINGAVAFALNICGYTQNPDGTGNLIDQAGFVAQHLLSNWAGLDATTPTYTNGVTWNGSPLFADATPKLRPVGFSTFQSDGATRMSTTLGPIARFVLSEPITLRDWFAAFTWSFNGFWVTNHHGQLYPILLPHGLAAGSGTLFRDRIEIKQWLTPTMDRQVITRLTSIFDFDAELQQYRQPETTITDSDLEDANGGRPKTRERIEMRLTGDPETASVSAAYWLELLKKTRRFQPFEVSFKGLESDLGSVVRTTHYDGIGSTVESGRLGVLSKHVTKADRDTVELTALDVSQLTAPASLSDWPDASETALTWGDASVADGVWGTAV